MSYGSLWNQALRPEGQDCEEHQVTGQERAGGIYMGGNRLCQSQYGAAEKGSPQRAEASGDYGFEGGISWAGPVGGFERGS
jgi:hypothetical protein